MTKILIAIAAFILLSVPAANADSWLSIEFYPQDDMFIAGGTSLGDHAKVDLWAFPGGELGFTIGPVIGPFAFGAGASMGDINGRQEVIWVDFDLGFSHDFRVLGYSYTWQSYNMFQLGVHDTDDFLLSRNWLTRDDLKFGLINHTRRDGDADAEYFVGPFYDFGRITYLRSNRLCLTLDAANGSNAWAAWVVSF